MRVADRLYPKDLFSLVIGRTDKFAIKPAPDSLLFVMDFFGAAPEETVYVGDSDVDVQFAHNAGIRCVSVDWGFRSTEEILSAGATCITSDPHKVPELVLNDPGKGSPVLINVYDFDNTIYRGDSSFDFFRHCAVKYPRALLPGACRRALDARRCARPRRQDAGRSSVSTVI